MTLIDRTVLAEEAKGIEIKRLPEPIKVRGIGTRRYPTSEYVVIDIYINAKVKEREVIIHFKREMHVVDGLGPGILLGVDIIVPEMIGYNPNESTLIFHRHNGAVAPVNVLAAKRPRPRMRTTKKAVIAAHSVRKVEVSMMGDALPEVECVFIPEYNNTTKALEESGGTYSLLAKADFSHILVRNDSDKDYILPRHTYMGYVEACMDREVYRVAPDAHELAVARLDHPDKRAAATIADKHTTVTPEGIMVYAETEGHRTALLELIADFADVFTEKEGCAKAKDLMCIPLKNGWQDKKVVAKIYPLSMPDRQAVDKVFDKLHSQGRMMWSNQATPFGSPVFVVKRTMPDGTKSSRVVVDVRDLNAWTVRDSYPLPRQEDIINFVQGALYITVVDAAQFFYQWGVHPDDWWKLAVNSHRGQEFFTVAPMGFCNSPTYAQRQADRITRKLEFVRVYVDDTITRSATFPEHLSHVRTMLETMRENHVTLKPTKSYFGFPSVKLLGQYVDGLGMMTLEDRIAAIKAIKEPTSLADIEHFLGVTGYLRDKIPGYAAVAAPLQARKTTMLKGAPVEGQARKNFARGQRTELTDQERKAFQELKNLIARREAMTHFQPSRPLYIDLDASKDGFGVMVYHLEGNTWNESIPPPRTRIQPVAFLSKATSSAESRYEATELEVACLVWTLRKMRHLVEGCNAPVIIYTDHASTKGIMSHTNLGSSCVDKLNRRLIRASQYVSQFSLDIRHRPGASNVPADSLSRLPSTQKSPESSNVLDEILMHDGRAFYMSTAQIDPAYAAKFRDGYQVDPILRKLWAQASTDAVPGRFYKRDDLLYLLEPNGTERLCVPRTMHQDIFAEYHDNQNHLGFVRTYQHIRDGYYIHALQRTLRDYILHCPKCNTHQTKRHKPYGSLRPVQTEPTPFHTICIDFIVGLPESTQGNTVCLTTTCKFSKRVGLLAGKATDTAEAWADRLLNFLSIAGWGIPRAMVCDRDPKFIKAFWQRLFAKLATKIMMTTAWHPQADGQSERTNQTVEISLRFCADDPRYQDWEDALPALMRILNSSVSAATGKSPDELIFGFKPFAILPGLVSNDPEDRMIDRLDASDAIRYAETVMKERFDSKHQPLRLKVGDLAYVRLHRGYQVASKVHHKFGPQRTGPFKVTSVLPNAYRLALPPLWKIHPVISIEHLEPHPEGDDPFTRELPTILPEPTDNNDVTWMSFEAIIQERLSPKQRKPSYLLRRRGLNCAWDEWRSEAQVQANRPDLIEAFKASM